jgi:hypothetical protein
LRVCFRRALQFAQNMDLRIIAFSSLGTQLQLKCPGLKAAQVALEFKC